jgi:uncharacterized membrane protein YuzA (DUF378 family)
MVSRPPEPAINGGQTPARAPGSSDNLVDLVRQLTSQGAHLAEQQLNLIKAEVREAGDNLKTAVTSMIGAAVFGIAGLGVLLMGVAYLLGQAIGNTGLATIIVGIVTLILALVLFKSGQGKMESNMTAERTRRTLERTPSAVRGDLKQEQNP